MSFIFGLDIGSTSVGFAVHDTVTNKIVALGVRQFKGAENPKNGASLATPRREARGSRKRLKRKRRRMKDVRKLIVSSGLLSKEIMSELFLKNKKYTPWELRSDGLDRLLLPEEWAKVLIHITKHRGFKSNRTISPEEKTVTEKTTEDGKANAGMKSNSLLLKSGNNGNGYRTIGEMIQKDPKFALNKHNSDGSYSNTIVRGDLESEIKLLFSAQRDLNNKFADKTIENKYLEIFNRQFGFASGDMIEKMVGFCSFEPTEKRAPKASLTNERFVLLDKIHNIRILVDGKQEKLSESEIAIIQALAYTNIKVTYKQIRKALNKKENWHFEKLPFISSKGSKKTEPEDAVFVELKAYHTFRKTISAALDETYWNNLISSSYDTLDIIAKALTYYKSDEDIISNLNDNKIDADLIKAILPLNFSGIANHSIKAMKKLIELMEDNKSCSEACEQLGYSQYNLPDNSQRTMFLTACNFDGIKNPVVLRAVSQTSKVVNALIRKYGSPTRINVELARDLSKSMEERRKIEKIQVENRDSKKKMAVDFEEKYGFYPNSAMLDRYRLWKEQNGHCPYTGQFIEPTKAFAVDGGLYVDIDHIVPYSRSFNNSMANKVLVPTYINRNKSNKTPFECFGSDPTEWDKLTTNVNTYIKDRKKADLIIRKDCNLRYTADMKERSLTDTRYITKYVANWMESSLLFADPKVKRPVTRINGQATATLRWQWGINGLKNRSQSNLHHALDACVIAAVTPSMIDTISRYAENEELDLLRETESNDRRSRLPEPWTGFAKEVEARLSENPADTIRAFGLTNYTDEELLHIKPILISRKEEHKATGPAHNCTVKGVGFLTQTNKTTLRVNLTSLTYEMLENMVNKEKRMPLYDALKKQLEEYKGDPTKAFKDEFRVPTKKKDKLGIIIRKVKVFLPGTSGVKICDGIASNGDMVRVDVYTKEAKYYLIPYYVDDIAQKRVKNQAIIACKDESLWPIVDESYKFEFSLYKNDFIKVSDGKEKNITGYYMGCDRSSGSINIEHHEQCCLKKGSKNKVGSVSYRIGTRNLKVFEKYRVDILGNCSKVKKETPHNNITTQL